MKRWIVFSFFIATCFILSHLVTHLYPGERVEKDIPILPSDKIERIISLSVSSTLVLSDLGLEDKIIGLNESQYNPPQLKEKTKVAYKWELPNIEAILSLRPDLVIGHKREIELLKGLGIPVYEFWAWGGGLGGIIELTRDIGRITGKLKEAERIAKEMESIRREIVEKTKDIEYKPKVYFEYGTGRIGQSCGPKSLAHELITLAGGENIAQDSPAGCPILNPEYIIEANPDIIIIEERNPDFGLKRWDYSKIIDEVRKRPGWQNIKAVEEDKIFISPFYFTYFVPRCIEGLEQFAQWFHPEVFTE